jgi:hypothetical protein
LPVTSLAGRRVVSSQLEEAIGILSLTVILLIGGTVVGVALSGADGLLGAGDGSVSRLASRVRQLEKATGNLLNMVLLQEER